MPIKISEILDTTPKKQEPQVQPEETPIPETPEEEESKGGFFSRKKKKDRVKKAFSKEKTKHNEGDLRDGQTEYGTFRDEFLATGGVSEWGDFNGPFSTQYIIKSLRIERQMIEHLILKTSAMKGLALDSTLDELLEGSGETLEGDDFEYLPARFLSREYLKENGVKKLKKINDEIEETDKYVILTDKKGNEICIAYTGNATIGDINEDITAITKQYLTDKSLAKKLRYSTQTKIKKGDAKKTETPSLDEYIEEQFKKIPEDAREFIDKKAFEEKKKEEYEENYGEENASRPSVTTKIAEIDAKIFAAAYQSLSIASYIEEVK